jgi:hypothetical protein
MIISVVIIAITTAPQIVSLFPEEVIICMCANAMVVVVQSASWCNAWKRRALLLVYGNEAPAALSLQIIALALSKLHRDFNFLWRGGASPPPFVGACFLQQTRMRARTHPMVIYT